MRRLPVQFFHSKKDSLHNRKSLNIFTPWAEVRTPLKRLSIFSMEGRTVKIFDFYLVRRLPAQFFHSKKDFRYNRKSLKIGQRWIVLDLLHAHRVAFSVLCTCQRHLFAIRTNFVSSVRKSARTRPSSAWLVLIHTLSLFEIKERIPLRYSLFYKMVGRGGFEPPYPRGNRFTVCRI